MSFGIIRKSCTFTYLWRHQVPSLIHRFWLPKSALGRAYSVMQTMTKNINIFTKEYETRNSGKVWVLTDMCSNFRAVYQKNRSWFKIFCEYLKYRLINPSVTHTAMSIRFKNGESILLVLLFFFLGFYIALKLSQSYRDLIGRIYKISQIEAPRAALETWFLASLT